MFGHNDNNSQQTDDNKSTETDAPAIIHDHHNSDAANPQPAASSDSPAPTASDTPASPASDGLLDLKQQALHSLQPLVSHLDQTPEEKFKTTMMLIQATDNSSLIKEAYEAANQITDEKIRAQALLDVVNEINYFTQNKS